MELTISAQALLWLFVIAACAGWVDALAGGGGLLTVPALMLAGVPPLAAVATNKAQAVLGTAVTSTTLIAHRHPDALAALAWMPLAAVGSILGAMGAFLLAPYLQWIVPIVLLLLALYFAVVHTRIRPRQRWGTVGQGAATALVGAYDGVLGSGAGTMYTASAVLGAGKDLVAATASAKVLNLASNAAALLVFLGAQLIDWPAALVMIVGQALGSYVGARSILAGRQALIRYVVVIMCSALCLAQVWRLW